MYQQKKKEALGLVTRLTSRSASLFFADFFLSLKKKQFGLVLRVQRALRLVALLGPEVQMQTHLQQSASDCTPHSARAA
jgi:hypothetical protein